MKKNKEEQKFKVPSRKKPVFKVVSWFLKLKLKKPKIINLAGEISDKAIVVVNHSAKSGPPALDMYYPKYCAKWGAHEMFEDYKSRIRYLRDILYIKKLGKSKFYASLISPILAIFNPFVYKGMRMLPTYPDGRLVKTIKNSIAYLDSNASVMVFPEDSNNGYKEVLTGFFPGFVILAEKYFKEKGEDIPIYPVYYHLKRKVMVIDKPVYVQELKKQGMDRNQIAQYFCDKVNGLFFDYVKTKD